MAGTTIGAVLRSTQAYCLQISSAESLEWGVAYTSSRFAGLYEANQLREFMVSNEHDVPTAFAAVEAYFTERGLRCYRWAPVADQPYEAVGQFLWDKGYRRVDLLACTLASWRNVSTGKDIRILPARPMRRQYRETFLDSGGPYPAEYQEACADAGLERLDDASFEARIALLDDRPVGRCALFGVGDIARVIDLYVVSEHRRRGVGAALLAHVLAIAQRFMARTICLEVEADNRPAIRCVERMGFAADGKLVEFHHPDTVAAT